jgi:hypothetical protein
VQLPDGLVVRFGQRLASRPRRGSWTPRLTDSRITVTPQPQSDYRTGADPYARLGALVGDNPAPATRIGRGIWLGIDRHQTLAGQHVTGFDPLEADNVGHERFRGSTLLSSAHLDQVRGRVIKNCRFSTALGLARAGESSRSRHRSQADWRVTPK